MITIEKPEYVLNIKIKYQLHLSKKDVYKV